MSLPSIDHPNLRDRVYKILRDGIVSRELAPGQRIDVDAIKDQLGTSRTPLKEALLRLEIEGLVRIVPRSGTYVTDPLPEEIADSFDVRRVLEVSAVGLAAARLTDDDVAELAGMVKKLGELASFEDRDAVYPDYLELDYQLHKRIVRLSGSSRLPKAHARENVHAQMARIRYRGSERELEVAQEEHERIIAALADRDVEAAKAQMDAHLRRAKRSLMDDIRRSSAEAYPV